MADALKAAWRPSLVTEVNDLTLNEFCECFLRSSNGQPIVLTETQKALLAEVERSPDWRLALDRRGMPGYGASSTLAGLPFWRALTDDPP